MRLNRFLARSGVCSRRNADLLIQAGRVAVNGIPVKKLGVQVDENQNEVTVDGKKVSLNQNLLYLLLNKPKDYLSTVKDNFRRPTVLDLVGKEKNIFPVGRLDKDTEGVLLLTNDGELTFRLTHPRFEIEKTYRVTVKGRMDSEALTRLKQGIRLEEGVMARGEGRIIQRGEEKSVFQLTLREGRKREVKMMCQAIGLQVIELKRIEFAGLTTKGLKVGEWRYLSEGEVTRLKKMARLSD
jgi:23S rRNA pseudouridine2605 synthase